jgi:hypothetical protein
MARATVQNNNKLPAVAKKNLRLEAGSVSNTDYTLDDLQSDVGHLYHLLEITVSGLCGNLDYCDSQRAAAVAWVARDLAETIKQKLDEGGGQPRSLTAAKAA